MSSNPPAQTVACDDALKKPLLFVHGWWGGGWVWDRFMACFSELGFECTALDMRGSSGSESPEVLGRLSFEDHLSEVRQAVNRLGDPILIGHSFGGLLIQKLVEQIDLPAAVLVGSAAPRGILALRSWALLLHAIRYAPRMLLQKPFLPGRDQMISLNLNRLTADERDLVLKKMVPASGRQAFEAAFLGVPVDARRVHTPMLVLTGSDDRLTPPAVGKAIARKYQAEYREYPENGHYIMREPNYQQIADEIHQWICETVRG